MKHRAREPVSAAPRILGLVVVSVLAFLGIALVQTLGKAPPANQPTAVTGPVADPTTEPAARLPNCSVLSRADIHPPECSRPSAAPVRATAAKNVEPSRSAPTRHVDIAGVHITVRIYPD